MPDRGIQIAKALRHRMTDSERQLWTQLRAHRMKPWKFKRQQPIGPYIVDFVCFQANLVIEVDGGQHQDNMADLARDAWLEGQGFRVLRFWNNEVLKEMPAVLEKIMEILHPSATAPGVALPPASMRSSPPAPLPQGERGVMQRRS